jgi:hypothetical protein
MAKNGKNVFYKCVLYLTLIPISDSVLILFLKQNSCRIVPLSPAQGMTAGQSLRKVRTLVQVYNACNLKANWQKKQL